MCLRGEGEVLVLRQIPSNGVAGGQKIDDHENADEQKDHQQTVGPHTRRAASGEGFHPTEMGDKRDEEAEESGPFQKSSQPNFLWSETIADRSSRSQSHAHHAKGKRLDGHFHRAESTTRCAKKSIKARLLKKYTRSFVSTSPRTKWS